MIGSAGEAAVAAGFQGPTAKLADGWEFAGQGCSRVAYRSPTGVIYKIQGKTWDYPNPSEFIAARRLALRVPPKGWGVPKVDLFIFGGDTPPVIAMEDFGDKAVALPYEDTKEAQAFFGISDPHSGNIRFREGIYYCIDIGFTSHADEAQEPLVED